MRISNDESLRAGQIAPTAASQSSTFRTPVPSEGQNRIATPAAQVEFSAQAQTIASAKAAVDAAPDVREDLVARLKAQVDSGTYSVSGADIADALLRRSQADSIR